MCIHNDIRDCPLYMGMHIPNGPSCMTADLDNGCAVDQAKSKEAGGILYDRILLALRTKYPHDVGQVEWRAMGRAIERGEKPTCH